MTERVYLHYNRDLWAELIKSTFPLPSILDIWVLYFVNYDVLALKWPASMAMWPSFGNQRLQRQRNDTLLASRCLKPSKLYRKSTSMQSVETKMPETIENIQVKHVTV